MSDSGTSEGQSGRRVVVVGGLRTPSSSSPPLPRSTPSPWRGRGRRPLAEAELNPREIDAIIWGGVILPPTAPNVGREIVPTSLPASVEGMTVTRACAWAG